MVAPLDQPSPYAPGYGHAPSPMFGRDQILNEIGELIRSADFGAGGGGARLIGLRGTGKTSILAEVAHRVTEPDELGRLVGRPHPKPWVLLRAEASEDFAAELGDQVSRIGPTLDKRGAWDITLGAAVPGGVASVQAHRSSPPGAKSLAGALKNLAAAAAKRERPLMLIIDELHNITRGDLSAVAGVSNQLSGHRYPVVLLTAELPDRLQLEHITYFTDRTHQIQVRGLDPRSAYAAVVTPAKARGVEWDRQAATEVVRASGGYPYALQVYAAACWMAARNAGEATRITEAATGPGLASGREQMGRLYASRWRQLPDRPRRYLSALAHLAPAGGAARTRDVAIALGNRPQSWSAELGRLRDDHGAVLTSQRGTVQFAIPGWARWICEQEATQHLLSADDLERIQQIRAESQPSPEPPATLPPLTDG